MFHTAVSPIIHSDLCKEEEEVLFDVLRKGNVVLKKYSDSVKLLNRIAKSFRYAPEEFRERLFLPENHPRRISYRGVMTTEEYEQVKILGNAKPDKWFARGSIQELRRNVNTLGLSESDLAKVKAVASVQNRIIEGYVRMVCDLAQTLARRSHDQVLVDAEVLIQVGLMGVVAAVWGYRRDNVLFSTYVSNSIFRHMVRELAQTNPQNKLLSQNYKLVSAYYAASIENIEDRRFESIVSRVKITLKNGGFRRPTDKEIKQLRAAFGPESKSTIRDTEMQIDEGDGKFIGGINSCPAPVKVDVTSFNELLDRSGLDAKERELIEMAQEGSHGFQTRWAEKHNCSRTWAGKMLRKAWSKIEKARVNQHRILQKAAL